jgi:hypothetical protein
MTDLRIDSIALGTEEMPPREGESRAMNVSTIEITLTTDAKLNKESKAAEEAKAVKEKATSSQA